MKNKLLIFILLLYFQGFGQSVPNTNTFSLQDVVNVTGGNDLIEAFSLATGTFDPLYEGSKNSLLNFRNYQAIIPYVDVKYGYLYNHYAFLNPLGITADGWVIPSTTQWDILFNYLTASVAGGKMKMTGLTYWNTPNTGATNEVGFNAKGGGYRLPSSGNFISLLNHAVIASSTVDGLYNTFATWIRYNSSIGSIASWNNNLGMSLRALKVSTTLTNGQTGIYVGNDGKIYRTICIGTQEWVSCNLVETKYRDGSLIPEVTTNAAWMALTTGARCVFNNLESNAYE